MPQQIIPVSLTAPGFYGLNTQDSPTDMDPKFALEANNCVIDRSGRLASRKGWVAQHTTYAPLGTSAIESMGELIETNGTSTVIVAGNNKIFKFTGSALVEITYGGGGVAPTLTANNWQMASLNNGIVLFQTGHDPLVYDTTLSTTQYRRLSEHPTYAGTAPQADCVLSAYGRVWAARTATDKTTVKWTDTDTNQVWTGGTAGSLDLTSVWPGGGDEIIALAEHNNSLIIFGRRQILIYAGAESPSDMRLLDTIVGVGCIARDSVQNTGEDVVFLSDTGVRSVSRTIQEKSAPLRSISRNVSDDLREYTSLATASDIKSIYSPHDAFYLLSFRSQGITYCFDMRSALPDGSARTTLWTGVPHKSYLFRQSGSLLIGQAGFVGKYDNYTDNGVIYRMNYYTPWIDFGNQSTISILKKILAVVQGAQGQSLVFKWGFDYVSGTSSASVTLGATVSAEYGIAEYSSAEYSANTAINVVSLPLSSSGRVAQLGIEAQLLNYAISFQKIDVYTKEGRL